MADFTLEDVRESFTADMTELIGRIQEDSRSLLGAQVLGVSVPRSERGRTPLEDVEAHAHAIYGSSSLISITSLSTTAQALERLAQRGQRALVELERRVAEVRQIAGRCEDAAQQLGAMLTGELEGRPEDAREAAERLVPLLGEDFDKLEAPPADGEGPPERREFSFGDEEPEAPAEPHQDELLEVFQQEAREYLVGLQGHLHALGARPNDLAVAGQVERIYHTIKGAAATVGLAEVSARAALLQAQFEEVAEGTEPLTPALLGDALRNTNRMLQAADLPEITIDLLKPAEVTVEGDRTRTFFLEEAEHTCREAAGLIEALGIADAERRPGLTRQLGQLFHRLKGSALVLGDKSVADVSARLQLDCARGASADELRVGLKHLENLVQADVEAASVVSVGQSEASAASVGAVPERRAETVTVSDEPELWEAFTQECQELLEALDRDIFGLEQSASPLRGLEDLMRLMHTLKGAVNSVGMAPTGKLLHEAETVLEALVAAPTLPPLKEVARVFLAVQQEVRLNLRQAPTGTLESSSGTWAAWAAERLRPGPRRAEVAEASRSGGAESEADRPGTEKHLIRVTTERLDELMNLSGELVVSRSRLVNRVATLRSLQGELGKSRRTLVRRVDEFRERYEYADLDGSTRRHLPDGPKKKAVNGAALEWERFSALELDRYEDVHILSRSLGEITDDLAEMDAQLALELGQIAEDSEGFGSLISRIQGEVTRARMVPVESLFARLQLPVRDAAERAGKEVTLRLEGEKVNIDKTIVDALYKPLLHLVRNAVFHGIESPAEREQSGKPRAGVLTLRARQESGQVVIEVGDDGQGLDLEKLKARGVATGLVSEAEPLGSRAVRDLVFARGISTSPTVSSVAGRGVGGEVVKRSIERLNGEVRSETATNRGTTFVITLPLTLIITQALLVRSSGRVLALPLFFAERIVELESAPLAGTVATAQIKVGEEYLPLRRVEALFGEPAQVTRGPVVVLRIGDRRLAIQVDQLLAREEIVVKSLGDVLSGHLAFAGVTMRGNGELVLVLDVPGVMDGLGPRTSLQPAEPVAARQLGAPVSSVASHAEADSSSVSESAPSLPTVSATPRPIVGEPRRLRVLVVDDSLSVRKVAEKALVGLGVDVTLAVDGVDALTRLREQDFDLVFTDLEMPRLHGYELIREIRFLPKLKGLPVVVVSSRSGAKHQDQARALGATDYLTKPFTAQMLDAILKRYVKLDGDRNG
jgi:chemosensory pili system protein ChpA (sensor histidine kinase/response regulator)